MSSNLPHAFADTLDDTEEIGVKILIKGGARNAVDALDRLLTLAEGLDDFVMALSDYRDTPDWNELMEFADNNPELAKEILKKHG